MTGSVRFEILIGYWRWPIVIVMTKQQYQEILEHSRNALPNEACGLLAAG